MQVMLKITSTPPMIFFKYRRWTHLLKNSLKAYAMYDFQQYFNIMQMFQTWGYDQTMKSQTRETPVSTDSNIPGMVAIFIRKVLLYVIA